MSVQPEDDEELRQWASATPPLVRAEYAWLSAAKQGAHDSPARLLGREGRTC